MKREIIAGPTDEREAISGNRTCHFYTGLILPFKTAAFALGQLPDPGQVGNRRWGFIVELSPRLILTKFDNFLTLAQKKKEKRNPVINEGEAERRDRGSSNFTLNC